jgi:hypothetical protein
MSFTYQESWLSHRRTEHPELVAGETREDGYSRALRAREESLSGAAFRKALARPLVVSTFTADDALRVGKRNQSKEYYERTSKRLKEKYDMHKKFG